MSLITARLKFIEPHRLLISTALLVALFVSPALADWWIVRSADGVCLVVDIQPTGKDPTVTKVGKDSYQTEAEANADLKRLCEEPKVPTKPNRPQ